MTTKNINISKIVPILEKLLKDGKTVQMEYNHQDNSLQVYDCNVKVKANDNVINSEYCLRDLLNNNKTVQIKGNNKKNTIKIMEMSLKKIFLK